MRSSFRSGVCAACATVLLSAWLAAQGRDLPEVPGSIVSRTRVTGAPVVADVAVTIPRVMGAARATPVAYRGGGRFERDGEGRVRVDQFVVPAGGGQSGDAMRSIIQPDPGGPTTLLVDHTKRLLTDVGPGMALMLVGGGGSYVVAIGQRDSLSAHSTALTQAFHGLGGEAAREEPLGSRVIAGVEAIGCRLTVVLPPGAERNDEPVELVEERWESPELQPRVTSFAPPFLVDDLGAPPQVPRDRDDP